MKKITMYVIRLLDHHPNPDVEIGAVAGQDPEDQFVAPWINRTLGANRRGMKSSGSANMARQLSVRSYKLIKGPPFDFLRRRCTKSKPQRHYKAARVLV